MRNANFTIALPVRPLVNSDHILKTYNSMPKKKYYQWLFIFIHCIVYLYFLSAEIIELVSQINHAGLE